MPESSPDHYPQPPSVKRASSTKLVPGAVPVLGIADLRSHLCSGTPDSLRPHGLRPQAHRPWGSPGENSAAGFHFPLQRISPTQGLNPSPALQADSFPPSHLGRSHLRRFFKNGDACCCLVASDFVTPWTAARQASLSFPVSPSLPKFMSIELVMLSNHLQAYAPGKYVLKKLSLV